MVQYNVNPKYNEELKKRCPELDGYIKYIDKTRKYHSEGMNYEDAVKKSVNECIKENILREFFIKNKAEVISMTIFEYDEEEHMRLERQEQYRKGQINHLKNQIKKKIAKGKTISQIADELEEDKTVIEELVNQLKEE